MSTAIVNNLLFHNENCGVSGEICYENRNLENKQETNVLYFPYCSFQRAIELTSERAKKVLEDDPFTPLEEYKMALCDTVLVKEKIGTGCGMVLPEMDGEVRSQTDEGYDLEVNVNEFVGKGKECVIHEMTRNTATSVLAICAIEPENVDGVDESNVFYKMPAEAYTRKFSGQITENQIKYVTWLMGKFDKLTVHIGVACEIFAWVGIRPRDSTENKLFTRTFAYGTIFDYFGGKDDGYHKGLKKAHEKLTTMGRPTSMIYNSLSSILIVGECKDNKKFRTHIDDKFLSRSHQTGTFAIVDVLFPKLSAELLSYCGISMALFTDAIDVIHDYYKCPSSNGLLPIVIRGYCIRSALLASYRRTLQVLPEEYKQPFRDCIKGAMYACVTSGRHYVMEQTIGCHCDDENRVCKKWKPKNCRYFVDDDNGEDYMDNFTSTLTEPSLADRDKLISKVYTYLVGKMEHEDLFSDPDLESKAAWTWSRLQHTCMIHKCPHSEGKDKRR